MAIVGVSEMPLGGGEFRHEDAALLWQDIQPFNDVGSLEADFLQMCWTAQEDAGYPASALRGSRTGVYINVPRSSDHPGLAHALSRFHDLRGPSLQWDLQSGCWLQAVAEAFHALRRGACDQALAGGVTQAGRAVMVLLAPLPRASALGQPVDAVVIGAMLQHEGHAPLATEARDALRAAAWADAGVPRPDDATGPDDAEAVELLDLIARWRVEPAAGDGASEGRYAVVGNPGEGGSHVRLVLQRQPVSPLEPAGASTRVVPLSAPSTRQLKAQARQLLAAIRSQSPDFDRLAYTLQAGRDAFPVRAAFVATHLDEFARQLEAFAGAAPLPPGCHCGEGSGPGGGFTDLMETDVDARAMVSQWLAKGKHGALSALWVTGVDWDWTAASGTPVPGRIHLPGHVFAGSRLLERETASALASADAALRQDIAIVGLSGRFPGGSNLRDFWQRLLDGENCVREIPSDRWDWRTYHSEEKGRWGAVYNKWGGFIDRIDCFDPLFFNISPLEAENMDPQERLLLEEAHACVADAGYTPATLSADRKVGVFVAVMNSAYSLLAEHWSIANRVSSVFNFNGPSLAIDTACSSSLTALHYACESVRRGHSECAIVGAVSLIVDPVQYMRVSERTMVTSGDACRSFGADADGFVEAEGVGAVLVKPLAKAVADGDHVYGVIKATAVNHGGRTRGYYVPSSDAQAAVISQAIDESGCHPRSFTYVEAHGTGTLRGDPIELDGLRKAFSRHTADTGFCAIGSVKSNIGHCESAAGMAGLAKLLLQLRHQTLVKSLHSERLNPRIDFDTTPFVVQQCNAPWQRPMLDLDGTLREYPRRAGLSSFGGGGANAHVVIEEHVDERVEAPRAGAVLIILSAANHERLQAQVEQLRRFVETAEVQEGHLHSLGYTLQVGREALAVRAAWIVESMSGFRAALSAAVEPPYRGTVAAGDQALGTLAKDDDLRAAMNSWLRKGRLDRLAQAWVKGFDIDWVALHGRLPPRRMNLPTYPFARERYWSRRTIDRPAPPVSASVAVAQRPAEARDGRPETPAPASDDMQAFIVAALADALNIPADRIEPGRSLLDYGMDSVVGMKLIQRIESAYPVSVGGRDLFEHLTAQSLAAHLTGRPGAAPAVSQPDVAVLERFEQGQLDMEEVHRLLGLRRELQ